MLDGVLIALLSVVFLAILYFKIIERTIVLYLYKRERSKPAVPWYDSDFDGPRFH